MDVWVEVLLEDNVDWNEVREADKAWTAEGTIQLGTADTETQRKTLID